MAVKFKRHKGTKNKAISRPSDEFEEHNTDETTEFRWVFLKWRNHAEIMMFFHPHQSIN